MKTDLVSTGYIIWNDKVLLVHHHKLDLWLPVGGHMEKDETPDDTMIREAKEETNLNIELLGASDIPVEGNTVRNLATPFYVNVHNVKDHHHCSFFYVCRPLNPTEMKINAELRDAKWFSKKDLAHTDVPPDVRSIAMRAFALYEKLK
ncbi:MAG: NUDIX domain-containing protein [Nanoarchaeota archaeon]